jgi:hypothetical protein
MSRMGFQDVVARLRADHGASPVATRASESGSRGVFGWLGWGLAGAVLVYLFQTLVLLTVLVLAGYDALGGFFLAYAYGTVLVVPLAALMAIIAVIVFAHRPPTTTKHGFVVGAAIPTAMWTLLIPSWPPLAAVVAASFIFVFSVWRFVVNRTESAPPTTVPR